MIEMHGDAVLFSPPPPARAGFRDHFLADAVTGNDRDPDIAFWRSSRVSLLSWPGANALI